MRLFVSSLLISFFLFFAETRAAIHLSANLGYSFAQDSHEDLDSHGVALGLSAGYFFSDFWGAVGYGQFHFGGRAIKEDSSFDFPIYLNWFAGAGVRYQPPVFYLDIIPGYVNAEEYERIPGSFLGDSIDTERKNGGGLLLRAGFPIWTPTFLDLAITGSVMPQYFPSADGKFAWLGSIGMEVSF